MRYRLPPMATALVLLATLTLTGCSDADYGPPPKPVDLTRDATGYYCSMIVADHPGPKAQIHLAGRPQPVFFPSVVDAIAFLMMPGESKAVRAIYVNDMGRAYNWKSPEAGTWIDAHDAFFVLDSRRKSGMGQKEAVPFGTKEAAEEFVRTYGGYLARLKEVSANYIFPAADPVEPNPQSAPGSPSVRKEAAR